MFKRIFILFIAAGLASLSAIWQIQVPIVETLEPVDDAWVSSKPSPTRHWATLYTELRQLDPWTFSENKKTSSFSKNADKNTRGKIGGKTKWKLAGIVQQGYQRYVLILDNKNKMSQYRVKSILPNGERLVSIGDDFIQVWQADEMKIIKLYPYLTE